MHGSANRAKATPWSDFSFRSLKIAYFSIVFRAKNFVRYWLRAKGRHGTHSPFAYALIEEVINPKKQYYAFDAIEDERMRLLGSSERIAVTDLGAGSKRLKGHLRSVSDIAATAVKRPKYAQLLFRLVQHLHYRDVLELGGSLGITTAYLAAAAERVTSIEGCSEHIRLAGEVHRRLQLNGKITLINDAFDRALGHPAEGEKKNYDLIYIDGDHRGEALLRYVELLLPRLNATGCLVVDDINWSADMHAAWETLRADPRFEVSVDLFEMGLLFLPRGIEPQHFVLRC